MASNNSAKGNPASHRMSNQHRKAYLASSWEKARKRKDARIKANAEREARNKKLRALGKPTPWEWSKQTGKTAHANTREIFKVAS